MNEPRTDGSGVTAIIACQEGHTEVVRELLAANANVNQAKNNGATPLYIACLNGFTDVVTQEKLLCCRRQHRPGRRRWCHAAVHRLRVWPHRDRHEAARREGRRRPGSERPQPVSRRRCTRLLVRPHRRSSRSCLPRTPTWTRPTTKAQRRCGPPASAATSASSSSSPPTAPAATSPTTSRHSARRSSSPPTTATTSSSAWLVRTRLWSTALHHLEFLDAERVLALRAGADIYAAAMLGGPTPLSLARAAAAGRAAEGSAAFLVLEAAKPWSRQTHKYFPAAARARAVELMRLALARGALRRVRPTGGGRCVDDLRAPERRRSRLHNDHRGAVRREIVRQMIKLAIDKAILVSDA